MEIFDIVVFGEIINNNNIMKLAVFSECLQSEPKNKNNLLWEWFAYRQTTVEIEINHIVKLINKRNAPHIAIRRLKPVRDKKDFSRWKTNFSRDSKRWTDD